MPKGKRIGDRYILGKTIGVGAFAKVKEATSLKTEEKFACKIMQKAVIRENDMMDFVRSEIGNMQKLPVHPHVVNLYEVLESDNYLYLIIELVSGGNLFDILKTQKKFNENEEGKKYFGELMDGIHFMHEHRICHRDLKLENLLICSETGHLKISDFGLSGMKHSDDHVFSEVVGSKEYVAPEVIKGNDYDGYKADVWSAGVILFVLLAGRLPFTATSVKGLFEKIAIGDLRYPPHFSRQLRDLCEHMFMIDPDERASVEFVLNHPWLQGDNGEPRISHTITEPRPDLLDDEKYPDPSIGAHPPGFLRIISNEIPGLHAPSPSPSASPNISSVVSSEDDTEAKDEETFFSLESELGLKADGSSSLLSTSRRPHKMTAFDLIGIVSTQMLNSVFTQHLSSAVSHPIQTYTRFACNESPIKILYTVDVTLRAMKHIESYTMAPDGYELYVNTIWERKKLQIHIQILRAPNGTHFIECRRLAGDIFKYYSFYEEFHQQFLKFVNGSKKQEEKEQNLHVTVTPSRRADSPETAGQETPTMSSFDLSSYESYSGNDENVGHGRHASKSSKSASSLAESDENDAEDGNSVLVTREQNSESMSLQSSNSSISKSKKISHNAKNQSLDGHLKPF